MTNFDRQYRLEIGQAGGTGFQIGEGVRPIHICFSIEKADTNTQNTAKLTVWNLNDEHLAELDKDDCNVILKAGYGSTMPIIFAGVVTFIRTKVDGGDRMTEIDLVDSRVEVRDTCVSLSYSGKVNCRTLIDDAATHMGLAPTYSYNASFCDIPDGYSFVGQAREVLTKACETSGLVWSINNGILQIKKPQDTMDRQVYELSAKTGLIGEPERVKVSGKAKTSGNSEGTKSSEFGWDVTYLMNAAIDIDDYVYLNSKKAKGFFRVYSVAIDGDNYEGEWVCKARLLEAK